jgi:hypothetical protein
MKIILLIFLINNPLFYIYQPKRLYLLDPNKTVYGVVKKVIPSLDGDIHINLSVNDSSLLVKNNYKHEMNCLVLEVVCANKSPFKACKNYKNNVLIPNVGDSIRVNGCFVFDKRHKINEIHPVLEIKKLYCST